MFFAKYLRGELELPESFSSEDLRQIAEFYPANILELEKQGRKVLENNYADVFRKNRKMKTTPPRETSPKKSPPSKRSSPRLAEKTSPTTSKGACGGQDIATEMPATSTDTLVVVDETGQVFSGNELVFSDSDSNLVIDSDGSTIETYQLIEVTNPEDELMDTVNLGSGDQTIEDEMEFEESFEIEAERPKNTEKSAEQQAKEKEELLKQNHEEAMKNVVELEKARTYDDTVSSFKNLIRGVMVTLSDERDDVRETCRTIKEVNKQVDEARRESDVRNEVKFQAIDNKVRDIPAAIADIKTNMMDNLPGVIVQAFENRHMKVTIEEPCPKCQKTFKSEYSLKKHLSVVHDPITTFKRLQMECMMPGCFVRSRIPALMELHRAKHRMGVVKAPNTFILKCVEPGCFRESQKEKAYLAHIRKSHKVELESDLLRDMRDALSEEDMEYMRNMKNPMEISDDLCQEWAKNPLR